MYVDRTGIEVERLFFGDDSEYSRTERDSEFQKPFHIIKSEKYEALFTLVPKIVRPRPAIHAYLV